LGGFPGEFAKHNDFCGLPDIAGPDQTVDLPAFSIETTASGHKKAARGRLFRSISATDQEA
jgi:hypothetical protein